MRTDPTTLPHSGAGSASKPADGSLREVAERVRRKGHYQMVIVARMFLSIRYTCGFAVVASAVVLGCSGPAPAATTCVRVASPSGADTARGTAAAPFRTAQRLVNSLRPGQVGCLRAGTYRQARLVLRRGGTSTARVTLTSYPGERARLAGGMVEIAPGANYVTLSNLSIDGAKVADDTVWIEASHATVKRVDITNENSGQSCMIIGSAERSWGGPTARVTIKANRFHQCGNPADGNQDHAIYIEDTSDSLITDNVFWGTSAYAIHLYPNAQNTRITHNVIADNGRGVIFGGDSSNASSNNTVAYNVIADTSRDPNIRSFWGGRVGTGNTAHNNCLFNGNPNDIGTQTGFTAFKNIHANPAFVNPANHDYQLSARSRCLAVVGYDTVARLAGRTRAAASPARHARRTRRRRPG